MDSSHLLSWIWWRRVWKEQGRELAILLLALFCIRSSLADWNVVPTGSMKPTIIEGDRIFVNKLAYDLKVPFTNLHIFTWGDPRRGEIVVFDSPKDGIRLVKRVVAIPGDTVELRDNHLLINGEEVAYGPLDQATIDQVPLIERSKYRYETEVVGDHKHAMMLTSDSYNPQRYFGPKVVPDGCYFMMGDNRDNSADSRFIGFVPRANIVGRSSRVVLSLNYDNYYLPRLGRFFKAMP